MVDIWVIIESVEEDVFFVHHGETELHRKEILLSFSDPRVLTWYTVIKDYITNFQRIELRIVVKLEEVPDYKDVIDYLGRA